MLDLTNNQLIIGAVVVLALFYLWSQNQMEGFHRHRRFHRYRH